MANPDTKTLYPIHQFVDDFASWVRDDHDIRYCFVIGAGASRSSGIQTGASLVDTWLRIRFEQERPGAAREEIQQWANETFQAWDGFCWENRASFYGRSYEWFYRDNATGQAALRKLMRGKSPSFGYSVLATILAETNHKVVLTTNFDNLVRDAIGLHVPNADPFVCHGEKDARFLAGHANRVRIVKIHGDIDRETYNAAAQIEKLDDAWEAALRGIFTDHTPIFLGYGGNDPGFMKFLTETLNEGQFRARPIWAYRVDLEAIGKDVASGPVPPGWPDGTLVHQFMEKHRGLWLAIPGFDELMLLLGHSLEYKNQAALIRGEADRRARDYERTLAEAVKSLRSVPCRPWCPQLEQLASAAELHVLGEAKRRTWDEWHLAIEATPSRQEQTRLFEEALKELKDSPELKAFYAGFLAEETPNAPVVDQMIQEARSLAEKSSGADSLTMLTVLHHQARIESFRGHPKAVQSLAEELMRRRRTALGQEHPDTLRTMNLLANALSAQGNYPEAEQLHRRALEARVRTLGAEHPDTLRSISNLANVLSAQGNYPEAEKLYRQALETQERTLGAEHRDTLLNVSNVANSLSVQGIYPEAEKLYRRALEAQERILGAEHSHTLGSVGNLANVLSAQGNYPEAEQLHRRALEARERMLGAEHPHSLNSVSNLANALSDQGNYPEAEKLCRRALEARERTLGAEHPDTLSNVSNLANSLSVQGIYPEAEKLYRRALDAQERTLGAEHPNTLSSVNNLANVLSAQGNYPEAEKLCHRALEAQERTLGAEHPNTLSSVNNLANVLSAQGNYPEAEQLHRRALEARVRTLGAEHPDTLSSVSNLANALSVQGNYPEAEKLYRRALEAQERTLGTEHPDTLGSVNNLATVLSVQGNYPEAEKLYRRAASSFEKVLGKDHPTTRKSQTNLAGFEKKTKALSIRQGQEKGKGS